MHLSLLLWLSIQIFHLLQRTCFTRSTWTSCYEDLGKLPHVISSQQGKLCWSIVAEDHVWDSESISSSQSPHPRPQYKTCFSEELNISQENSQTLSNNFHICIRHFGHIADLAVITCRLKKLQVFHFTIDSFYLSLRGSRILGCFCIWQWSDWYNYPSSCLNLQRNSV